MKLIFLAAAMSFAVTTTAFADQYTLFDAGMAKGGGRVMSFVDKDSVESKNPMVRFIVVRKFEKPQLIPKDKKSFNILLQEVYADCTHKTLMNPTVAFMNGKKTLVERAATGETKLSLPSAKAKIMLSPAVDLACKIAQGQGKKS